MKKILRLLSLLTVSALLLGGCAGTKKADDDTPIPPAAIEADMTRLAFYDDFDDPNTIDWDATGAEGYKWYVDRPFGWDTFTREEATVENSVLTLTPNKSWANWSIASYSAKGDTGTAFKYAYYEARIRIDIDKTKDDLTQHGSPAWWSFSVDHTTGKDEGRWGELDFFEVWLDEAYDGIFVASVHDSIIENGRQVNRSNPNNVIENVLTEPGWHTYGCLWTPGEIYWYFDDKAISSVIYSSDALPFPAGDSNSVKGCYDILDQEDMLVILGTGPDWPMEVDWVRVWQA